MTNLTFKVLISLLYPATSCIAEGFIANVTIEHFGTILNGMTLSFIEQPKPEFSDVQFVAYKIAKNSFLVVGAKN